MILVALRRRAEKIDRQMAMKHTVPPVEGSSESVRKPEMAPGRPPLPWRTRLFAAAINVLSDAARSSRGDGAVNRALLAVFDRTVPPTASPVAGVASSDHTVDPSRNLWLRLYSPSVSGSCARPLPVVLYFHGGGFAFHSAASGPYDAFCRRLARGVPALVASLNYRLAPEHRFPAAYDDGVDALSWLDSGAGSSLVPDLSAVFLAGDSAGGNIAHHVARRTAAPPPQRVAVAGVVAIQPFFGGEEETASEARLYGAVPFGSRERYAWMWRSFLPKGSDRDHEAANVFGPGSGSEGSAGSVDQYWARFPPAMVFVGGWDPLQDRQRLYAQGLRDKRVEVRIVEYPNAIHGFYIFPELTEVEQVISDVADFVRARLGEAMSQKRSA